MRLLMFRLTHLFLLEFQGCTVQACGFRDNFQKFTERGYKVFGVSADSCATQLKWKTKNNLPFHLLSDLSKDRRVLNAFGVSKTPASISRSHVVVGKGGVIEDVHYGVSPKESVLLATEFVAASVQGGE